MFKGMHDLWIRRIFVSESALFRLAPIWTYLVLFIDQRTSF